MVVSRKQSIIFVAFILALASLLALLRFGDAKNDATPSPTPTRTPLPVATGKLASFYNQSLKWTSCKDGFDCATLTVPLDYSNPMADSITLNIVRHKALKASRGALVVNPGGPGGSGIEYARAIDYIMSPELINRFDVVGFDPRGVGSSTPVHCLSDKELDDYINSDQSPNNQSEIDDYVKVSKQLGDGCASKSPRIYRFMDTVSAARDIDILRSALGEAKLNWFGKSYGTFLGATYADLFPTKVGRMMLDGAIDPTLSNEQLSYGQALGFENALKRFVSDCSKQSDCPLDSGISGIRQIATMLDELDTKPVLLTNGRVVSQSLALIGVLGDLYDKNYGWPDLRGALTDALQGDFTALATSADFYITRDKDGHYTDNSNEAIAAVNCLDRPDRATVEQTLALAKKWKKAAPVFGEPLAWGNLGCTYWPSPATGSPTRITAAGSPLIVVVGTVHDPATPYQWAQALTNQLSNGVLLTFNGDGHTAYFQGSTCVDDYIDQYFLTGKADPGITCEPDQPTSSD